MSEFQAIRNKTYPKVKPTALASKNVIITGEVPSLARSATQQVLLDAGAIIEKSLNKKVNLVVVGPIDPGEKKLKKAKEMNIETKTWDDLIAEIRADEEDTDEESAPAQAEEDAGTTEDEEVEEPEEPKKSVKGSTPQSIFGSGGNSVEGKMVIITGRVPGHDRKAAAALLENAGATIAKSLNKSVELVVLGTNPGPDKLKKIEDMGIATISWKEVANGLGLTDEVDDDDDDEPAAPVKTVDLPKDISGKMLLITGTIEGHTRSSAQRLLESEGAKFAKSLNKQVELVVLGTNPGPDKMKSIADMGIGTIKWEELVQGLGLPDGGEPPKKKAKKG